MKKNYIKIGHLLPSDRVRVTDVLLEILRRGTQNSSTPRFIVFGKQTNKQKAKNMFCIHESETKVCAL